MRLLVGADQFLKESSPMPWWYGISYADPWTLRFICYPIPLNVLVSMWRHLVHFFKRGWKPFIPSYNDLLREITELNSRRPAA